MTPYVELNSSALGEALTSRFEAVTRDDAVILSGECPRCEHEFSFELPTKSSTIVPGRGLSGQSAPDDLAAGPVEHTVYCRCGYDHDGRPDGESGCGAMANVTLRAKGPRRAS
jgi:hypothetical protein